MGKRVWFLGVSLLFGTLIVSRDVIVAKSAEVYISRKIDSYGWNVLSIERDRNVLKLKNLSFQSPAGEVFLEEMEASFHLSLFPLKLEPSIFVSDILITLQPENQTDSLIEWPFFLFKDSWIDMKLLVERGILQSLSGESFSFSFQPGEKAGDIGSLSIKDKEENSFLLASLGWEEESIISKLQIEKGKVTDLISLGSFIQKSTLKGEGEVSISLNCSFHPLEGIERMEGTIDLQEVILSDPIFGFDMNSHNLKGTLLFSKEGLKEEILPFWKNIDLFLTFEDSSFFMEKKGAKIGFEEGLGEIRLQPEEDPYLKMGGKLFSKGLSIPFEVEGKGQLLEKGSYWIQTQADFFLAKSSPHIFISLCQNEGQESLLQAECSSISQEIFDLMQISFPLLGLEECPIEIRELEGKFLGRFVKGVPEKLEFLECKAKDVAFSIPSKKTFGTAHDLSLTGVFERKGTGSLEVESLEAEVRKASLSFNGEGPFESISGRAKIDLGEFAPSYIEGFYQGVFGSVQVLEKTAKDLFHIECKASSEKILQRFFPKQDVFSGKAEPVFISLDVSELDDKTCAVATVRLSSKPGFEEDVEVDLSLNKKLSRNLKDLLSRWDFSSFQGSFKTEKLSLDTFSPSLKGFFKGEGSFDAKELSMDLSQVGFSFSNSPWKVVKEVSSEEEKVHLEYEYKTKLCKGEILTDSVFIQNEELKLVSEIGKSTFFFEGNHFWTDRFTAKVEDAWVTGSLLVDETGVHVASHFFEGSLQPLKPLIARFVPSSASMDWSGTFSVEERGCSFDGVRKGESWDIAWKAAIGLKDLACDFGSAGRVKEAECHWSGNSEGQGTLSHMHGIYSLASSSAVFSLSNFYWSKKEEKPIDFSLLAKDEVREWVRLQGKVERKAEGFVFSFAPHSHLLGLGVTLSPITVDLEGGISPIELSSSLKLEQLPSYLTMWKEMGLESFKEAPSFLLPAKGTLQFGLMYDKPKALLNASLKGSDISYQGNLVGQVSGKIQGEKGAFKVDSFQVGPYLMKSQFQILPLEWKVSTFSVESPDGKALAKGSYFPNSSKLVIPSFLALIKGKEGEEVQLQGSFEGLYAKDSSFLGKGACKLVAALPSFLQMGIESSKEIPFLFDSSKGVQVEKTDWNLVSLPSKKPLGKLSAKKIAYFTADKRLLVQGGNLSLPKESKKVLEGFKEISQEMKDILASQEIDLSLDMDFSPHYRKVSGLLKNGTYQIQNMAFDLKQIQLLLEQDTFYASCQSKWQDTPLWLQLQVELNKAPTALLLIKEQPDKNGMAMQLKTSPKKEWFCETIQGSLKGIDLQMNRIKRDTYDLAVQADFSKLQPVLPKEWRASLKKWGIGQGYAFKGSFTVDPRSSFKLASLSGDLSGEHFEWFGKSFDLFTSKIEFTQDKGRIQGIKLEDEMASLSIKTIDFQKKPGTGIWEVSSPLIHVKDFAPALFLKGGKERGVELKNVSLYDVKGALNDIDSFEAKGALHFSSLEKKEFSFWDVPLAMMKDWGLDPGLLTPIMGEADFVLHQGRFYFTDLRNAYSEGKRSQFYLAGPSNDAYLSLDGSWHVDLAMKQNVVWKITEDLIVSIRGTVEKPKYSFKTN